MSSTLVSDIYTVVSEGTEVSESQATEFGQALAAIVKDRLSPDKRDRPFTLRMSNLGKGDRQLWYESRMGSTREVLPAHTLLKFLFGDIIESLLLFLAKVSGHEVTDEQKQVDVDGIKGHMDAKIDGVVVDVKSASTHAFKKFRDGSLQENDPFGYYEQLAGYCEAEDTSGAWLAMDKSNGHIAYLEAPQADLKALNIRSRISHIKDVVNSDSPPERCYPPEPKGESGNEVLGINCSYCAHKFECWKDANDGLGLRTFLYSTGPVHFTKIKKEPNGPREVTF